MSVNFANIGSTIGGQNVDLRGAEWCIGTWVRGNGVAGANEGVLWQANTGSPGDYATVMSQNNQLCLYDTGNTSASVYNRRKWLVGGTDSAGVRFGPSTFTDGPATLRGILTGKQYETAHTYRELLVVQRRAGVSELWRCRPGESAELIASDARAWAGFDAIAPITWGAARVAVTSPFNNAADAPFHIADKALSPAEIGRICCGESPNSIDKTRVARAQIPFVSASSNGLNDTMTAWNPTAGTTITLNGTVVTFVASGAVGNQVNIGATSADTVTALIAFLNGSADANLSVATYESFGTSRLRIVHKTPGAGGEAYTLAASSANIRLPASGTLGYVEWELGSLSQTTYNQALHGGGYVSRGSLGSWGTVVAAIADLTAKPNAVRVDPIAPGRVLQHTGGFADLPLTGTYSGGDPSGVAVEVRDLNGDTVVLAESALVGFSAAGGVWSGTLAGLPKGKRWLSLRLRKAGGTDYTQTETPFGVGEVFELAGQSLIVLWTAVPSTTAPNGFVSTFMSSDYTDAAIGTNSLFAGDNNWHRYLTTAEGTEPQVTFGNKVADLADCVVGIFNRGRGGTSISAINADTEWAKRVVDLNNAKCGRVGWLLWNQGHADDGSAVYMAALDSLLAKARANYGPLTQLGLQLVSNVQGGANSTTGMYSVRKQQDEWLRAKMAVDPLVFSCGAPTDLTTADGVHPATGDRAKLVERMARGVLHKIGVSAISADGPRLLSATRTGAVIVCSFAMDPGATLKTIGDAAPTGFDVSANDFTSLLAISSVAITGPGRVTITLAADPGQEVKVLYLYGRPGKLSSDTTGRQAQTVVHTTVQSAVLYDDTASLIGLTVGKPARSTYAPVTTQRANAESAAPRGAARALNPQPASMRLASSGRFVPVIG